MIACESLEALMRVISSAIVSVSMDVQVSVLGQDDFGCPAAEGMHMHSTGAASLIYRIEGTRLLFFDQIIGEHELGDPRQNAAHQSQLQYFSVAKVLRELLV